MNVWISVEDSLPDPEEIELYSRVVPIYMMGGVNRIRYGRYHYAVEGWIIDGVIFSSEYVTHWMKIEKPVDE